jgi:hypothetical protein
VVVELLNQVANSVGVYFNALTQFGYKKQDDVNRLLVYSFIEEFLTGEMRYYITEEDYKLIERALSCLYGSSCLIPYPQYINNDYLFGRWNNTNLISARFTEDSNIRVTENDLVRFKASNYNR